MTLAVKLLLIAALVLGIIIPFGTFLLGEKSKKRYKRTIGANAFFFFGAFVVAGIMQECLHRQQRQLVQHQAAQPDLDTLQQHFQPVYLVSAVVSQ